MKSIANNEFLLFFKRLTLIVLLLSVTDHVLGYALECLFYLQPSGKYARINKSLQNTTADIIIFGSSQAHRHYNPNIIERNTGLKVHNSGVKGQGLLFTGTLHKMIINQHVPKVSLINIEPGGLFYNKELYDRLSILYPYSRKYDEVKDTIMLRGEYDKFKLFSNLFTYNSTIVHILIYFFMRQDDEKGFIPLEGKINTNIDHIQNHKISGKIDYNNIEALKKIIDRSKSLGSKVVISISPNYIIIDKDNNESLQTIIKLATEEGVMIFDYTNHEAFIKNSNLFNDCYHLNRTGAEVFSNLISKDLLKSLSNK